MNRDVGALIRARNGVVTRAEVLAVVGHRVLDRAVGTRQLVRLYPRIYVDPARAADPRVQARAALQYAGPDAALSHVTALALWRLPGGTLDPPVHLLVPATRRTYRSPRLIVHRRRGFSVDSPGVVVRSGLPVCRLEQSVVDSWALLPVDSRQAAVIDAVADRLTTPDRLQAVIDTNINLPDRRDLTRLVSLLRAGCRSPLELWGYNRVFVGPGMPRIEWNVQIGIGGRNIYLDAYCPEARVNFELDGAKYHSSARDRERDARRDAALAAIGIMVIRFTHDQLVYSPDLVRTQVHDIVAARLS